jgi:hypothetical protein
VFGASVLVYSSEEFDSCLSSFVLLLLLTLGEVVEVLHTRSLQIESAEEIQSIVADQEIQNVI